MMLPSKKISGLLIITAFLFCAATSAFGLSYNTLYMEDEVSNLYTLDSTTGAADLVGPTGISLITDIAFSGTSLFGVTFSEIYSIDPDTGAGTLIGPVGTENYFLSSLVAGDDGKLYAAGVSGDFISYDPVSGITENIGNYNIDGGGGASGDLVFVDGTLYASVYQNSDENQDYLATIDLGSGAATIIGDGLGYRDVFGLEYKDATLYGSTGAGDLLRIDTSTGLGTIVLSSSNNGLVQLGMTVSRIPEPATILLTLTGLGAVGLNRFRKRFKKIAAFRRCP